MKTYYLTSGSGLDGLQIEQVPRPPVGPRQVLVAMQAWSLNYRDLAMPSGGYPGNTKVVDAPPLVPLSDGAGEVIAVGDEVSQFAVGDRVASCFFEHWEKGPISASVLASARGGAIDGVLAEEVCFEESGLVHIPEHYSFTEAACLPCAALTAWEALQNTSTGGDKTLLTLGTGGVSLFALQFAKARNIAVSITSSSDEKLERAQALGATQLVNYSKTPEWDQAVLTQTDGNGVDHVIELGGAGTFERSLNAVRVGGHISLIGVLSGQPEQQPSPLSILFKRLCVQGLYVASKARFEEMNKFITTHRIHPIIDKEFSFDQAKQAYAYLKSAAHFGKVVLTR